LVLKLVANGEESGVRKWRRGGGKARAGAFGEEEEEEAEVEEVEVEEMEVEEVEVEEVEVEEVEVEEVEVEEEAEARDGRKVGEVNENEEEAGTSGSGIRGEAYEVADSSLRGGLLGQRSERERVFRRIPPSGLDLVSG
jgi:hypothetical protein